jgi:cytochrome c-type biogenesis protein CcmH/NrfF
VRLRHKFAAFGFALVLALSLSVPAHAQDARAKSLGTKIMCMCGGCNDAAGKCTHMGGAFAGPCAFAQKELKEVDERVSSGSSDDLILQSFVQEYGPTVLISPPAHGFDLWAWLMPVIVLLVGLILALSVAFHWKRRTSVAPAARVSPEMLSRVRHEAGGESDD